MEEVYPSIATEAHMTSNLHRKERPDETLQEQIQNLTDSMEKAKVVDLANVTN